MSTNNLPPVEVLARRIYYWAGGNTGQDLPEWEDADPQDLADCQDMACVLLILVEETDCNAHQVAAKFGQMSTIAKWRHGLSEAQWAQIGYVLVFECFLPPLTEEEKIYDHF